MKFTRETKKHRINKKASKYQNTPLPKNTKSQTFIRFSNFLNKNTCFNFLREFF